MKKYLNTTILISAVATAAGLFAYKQFGSRHVVKALGGTNA
jgi:hypothetical protein